MYQYIDNTLTLTVNDWISAGLSYEQFNHDSKGKYLTIFRRGVNGNTLIDVRSIKRPERLRVIEQAFGKIDEKTEQRALYTIEPCPESRTYYVGYTKADGTPLSPELIERYTAQAGVLESLKKGLQEQIAMRAKLGKRVTMGEWYSNAMELYNDNIPETVHRHANVRSFERLFKEYCKKGFASLISGKVGGDNTRKVSKKMEKLLISLWSTHDKPFVNEVHELYMEFVKGNREFYDRETGEIFYPSDFSYKGRPVEISEATVWNYLKDVVNQTASYASRNGNFDYVNKFRPKAHRKPGFYSLSKISMDDVALSRKTAKGWVYKYIAVDVVSGYYFRPAYVVGKPTVETVIDAFRNMFCELSLLGLAMPAELEVENHLMKDIDFLQELFPFVRFCKSPTEKRAEHAIKSLKWGTSKREGHTRGRWYAKHEAYRSVRNKVQGDYIETEYDPRQIIADDLNDIDIHNNELHPLQKTYTGMTRADVLKGNSNPNLKPIEHWYLYKFIGNTTDTSIRNNNHVVVNYSEFELQDFTCLKRLSTNSWSVTAYWLPDENGSIGEVYLYQGDVYIGKGINREQYAFNECKAEQTEKDAENILQQLKRISKYDKFIKDEKKELPKIGNIKAATLRNLAVHETVEIVENAQPKGYEIDEFTIDNTDYSAMGRARV